LKTFGTLKRILFKKLAEGEIFADRTLTSLFLRFFEKF